MFRRFMIVCWVLFSICAVTGLVGWAGHEYYDTKAEAFAERQREAHESKTPPQITNEEDAKFIADRIRDGTLQGERKEAAFQALEEFRQRQGLDPGQNVTPEEFFATDQPSPAGRRVDWHDPDIDNKKEAFTVVGLLGGILAGGILLWNILCHTVRWVWKGREKS